MQKIQKFPLFFFFHPKRIYALFISEKIFSLSMLCLTSLLCKTGTIILFVDILEFFFLEGKNTLWEQLALLLPVLVIMFLINYITCFLFKYIMKIFPTRVKDKMFVFHPIPPIHVIPWKEKIYLGFTNIFIASGPFKETR